MVMIDQGACVGCGLCVKDCLSHNLELRDGKAHVLRERCLKCAHCVSICPQKAVSMDDYDMSEVVAYDPQKFTLDPDVVLNAIKFRRSVRQFQKKPVDRELIAKLIESGRFTPTASNTQGVSYIVIQEEIDKAVRLAMESLNRIGEDWLKHPEEYPPRSLRYAQQWVDSYKKYLGDPEHNNWLFFNAPVALLIVSDAQVDAALAASSIELTANAMGLGCLYNGFFTRAIDGSEELRSFLSLEEGKRMVCIAMGYPAVRYQRTAPRKKAEILWK